MEVNLVYLLTLAITLISLYFLVNYIALGKPFGDIFSPHSVFVIFILVFFTPNLLFSQHSYHAVTLIYVLVGSLSYYFGILRYYDRRKLLKPHAFRFTGSKSICFTLCVTSLVLMALVFIIKLRFYGLTLFEYYASMLIFHAENIKSGGYFWKLFEQIIYALFLGSVIVIFAKDRTKTTFLSICVMSVCLFLFSGSHSRFDLFKNLLMVYLAWYAAANRPPEFQRVLVLLGPLLPPIFIALNWLRHGRFNLNEMDIVSAFKDSMVGDTKPAVYLDSLVRHFIDYGHDYNLGLYVYRQIIGIIPRFLWHDKPTTSMLLQYTFDIMDKDPFVGGETFTYTVFDVYSIAGFTLGVVIMFVIGFICAHIYRLVFYSSSLGYRIFSIVFCSNLINTLRGSLLDQITLIISNLLVVVFVGLVLSTCNIRIKSCGKSGLACRHT